MDRPSPPGRSRIVRAARGSGTGPAPATPGPADRVVATRFVLEGWPIRIVVRDRAGDWLVLGEQSFQRTDRRLTHWAELVELDRSLAGLPPLVRGTLAHRSGSGRPWHLSAA